LGRPGRRSQGAPTRRIGLCVEEAERSERRSWGSAGRESQRGETKSPRLYILFWNGPLFSDDPEGGRQIESTRCEIVRFDGNDAADATDSVAGEEPLEIGVAGDDGCFEPVAVLMRTPGDDFDLAAGFAFTEGVIAGWDDVDTIGYADPAEFNRVVIGAAAGVTLPRRRVERSTVSSSACGLCGKKSIDDVFARTPALDPWLRLDPAVVSSLPGRLRQAQPIFAATGGLHAAGLFDAGGSLVVAREDVGRHNAVDKIVGTLVQTGRLPADGRVLCVSGRAGFEIVQKAALAGVAAIVAVSAPSSLAVDLAERAGMTLVGFTRGATFNVYAHRQRIPAALDR